MKNSRIVHLEKTLKGFNSGWVSLSKDYKKIIAHSETLRGLVIKLERKGSPDGYIMKASADFSNYVG